MIRVLLIFLFSFLLFGCASDAPPPPAPEPPPPPTIVNLLIESATDVNPDNSNKAAPVMLRIYELREQSNFNAADFFDLYDKEQAALAGDLVHKQELLLKPGISKKLVLQPDADVHTIGFFAAFRQLDTAQWRAKVDVAPHETKTWAIKLNANQLIVEPVDETPKKP